MFQKGKHAELISRHDYPQQAYFRYELPVGSNKQASSRRTRPIQEDYIKISEVHSSFFQDMGRHNGSPSSITRHSVSLQIMSRKNKPAPSYEQGTRVSSIYDKAKQAYLKFFNRTNAPASKYEYTQQASQFLIWIGTILGNEGTRYCLINEYYFKTD